MNYSNYFLIISLTFTCTIHSNLLEIVKQNRFDDLWSVLVVSKPIVDIQDDDGDTPLIIAARANQIHCVVALLYSKASVNIQNKMKRTALMEAARLNHTEIVTLLLFGRPNHEISISAPNIAINLQDENGDTALILAAKAGAINSLNLILLKQPDLNRQNNNKNTALMEAIENKHGSIALNLLGRGADFKLKNKHNESTLGQAAYRGLFPVVKLLLQLNAEIESEEKPGITPLFWATLANYTDIMKELIDNGADTTFKNVYCKEIKEKLLIKIAIFLAMQ